MPDNPNIRFAKTVLAEDIRPIVTRLARKIDVMALDAGETRLRHDLRELRALTRLLQDRVEADQ